MMKRTFTFTLLALFATLLSFASTQAQPEPAVKLQPVKGLTVTQVTTGLPAASLQPAPQPITRAPRKRATSATDLAGTYAERDTSVARGAVIWPVMPTVTSSDASHFTVNKFYGISGANLGATLTGDSTFTISPQVVTNLSQYGDVYIYAAGLNSQGQWVYSTTQPIQGVIRDGVIVTAPWIMLSPSANTLFELAAGTAWCKTNATARHTDLDGVISTSPLFIYQSGTSTAQVVNFPTMITPLDINLLSPSKIEIQPQFIGSWGIMGNGYIYPADYEASPLHGTAGWYHSEPVRDALQGTVSNGGKTITFGEWGIFQGNVSDPLVYETFKSSVINMNDQLLSYPEAEVYTLKGSGTEADPFTIASDSDVMALTQRVRGGDRLTGKLVKVIADVDLAAMSHQFRPIGSAKSPFCGTFDGQGHEISGFNYTAHGLGGNGLFGYVGPQGVIKHVNLDAQISVEGPLTGGLVGSLQGQVIGCSVWASVASTDTRVGGVVGYVAPGALVDSCEFNVLVKGPCAVGGIAGYSSGTISHSAAAGIVTHGSSGLNTDRYAFGGVVGYAQGSATAPSVISDSYFSGTMRTTGSPIRQGGIVGQATYAQVSRCFNAGVLHTSATQRNSGLIIGGNTYYDYGAAGGLVGITNGSTFTDCYNSNVILNPYPSGQTGGLAGLIDVQDSTPSRFVNCYNSGQVFLSKETSTMGLYGTIKQTESPLVNTYYDQQINGTYNESLGKSSSYFISGSAVPGFSSDVWDFQKNFYPTLKSLASAEASSFSSMTALLSGTETSRTVKSDFTLSSRDGFTWHVLHGDQVTTTGKGIVIDGNKAVLTGDNSTDTLVVVGSEANQYRMVIINVINGSSFEGAGTEADPFKIRTAADMTTLAGLVNDQSQTYEGQHFMMMNDIDMSSVQGKFLGIGSITGSGAFAVTKSFGGTFDGGGHTLHNLVIDRIVTTSAGAIDRTKSGSYAAAFASGAATSVIKNLNVAADCSFGALMGAAGIVGSTAGLVTNCRNYAPVTAGMMMAGGIAGALGTGGHVSHCYNAGTITTGMAAAGGIVGGIAAGDTVEFCQNDGAIGLAVKYGTSASSLGGIAASNNGVILDCVNQGTVSGKSSIGGITSTSGSASSIQRVVQSGIVLAESVNASSYQGAITGKPAGTYANCYFDEQTDFYGAAAAATTGTTGLTAAQFTSGKPLEGLDTAVYAYAAGSYPVLREFSDEPASQALSKIWVAFAQGDKANTVTRSATLSNPSGIRWRIKNGQCFSVSSTKLGVSVPKAAVATDSLTATLNGYSKLFSLRAIPSLFTGAGTEADPYQIRTVADWRQLIHAVNDLQLQYTGSHFKVLNDIDFTGAGTITPVGVFTKTTDPLKQFDGTLDGAGHALSHISSVSATTTATRYGLFGIVGANAIIKDLTVKQSEFAANTYVGAFAGFCKGTLLRCTNDSTIVRTLNKRGQKAMCSLGGLVGLLSGGTIQGCVNRGALQACTWSGGIASEAAAGSLIDSCFNYQDISTLGSVIGGIVGRAGGTISRCANYGNVSSTNSDGSALGGISGLTLAQTTIIGCQNRGTISGSGMHFVGGISGMLNYTGDVVDSCENLGTLSGIYTVGGIGGYVSGKTVINNCVNRGNVTATKNTAAGIAGQITAANAQVTHSRNVGNIDARSATKSGGIVGEVTQKTTAITDCYNAGAMRVGAPIVGGIVGKTAGAVSQCFNFGRLVSTVDTTVIAGIAGETSAAVTDCYNAAMLDGSSRVGEIIGNALAGASAARCYNAAAIRTDAPAVAAYSVADTSFTATDVYYDASLLGNEQDARAKGLTTAELAAQDLGSAFSLNAGCYPILTSWQGDSIADLAVTTVLPAAGDKLNAVTKPLTVGLLPGVNWTLSKQLELRDDGLVYAVDLGNATLTASTGKWSKKFHVTVTKTNSITDVTAAQLAPVSVLYYNIAGQCLGARKPATGLVIERTTWSDGSATARKLIVK